MARKNKMDVALEIAIGSSLQIILFVAPVLIFLSLFFTPMSIVFNQFELIALIASVLIANRVSHDGESNWLEGVQLLAVYLIIAASFFYIIKFASLIAPPIYLINKKLCLIKF